MSVRRLLRINGKSPRLQWGILAFIMAAVTGLTVQCTQTSDDTTSFAGAAGPQVEQVEPAARNEAILPVTTVGGFFPGNDTFIRVAKDAMASVVNISSTRKAQQLGQGNPSPFFDDPFFRRFFGEEFEHRFRQPEPRREQGLGSGVIVSIDGYIVTNNHVVEQADELTVLLGDKRKFKAKLIGTDPKTDLAVIKIEAGDLPTLNWGDSGNLQVGEVVLAVGNPFGLNQTVTMGIISAVGRANMGIVDYEDFIQTDAAINPGNSGGALVNLKGELIGINTAIFSRTGGYMGIGFAIPSNMVKSIMNSLIGQGKVVRGWLGVSIQELTPELAEQFGSPDTSGALVGNVVEDSPAEEAGLRRGDIIRTYKGASVKDPTRLRSLVTETTPGTRVPLTVLRDEEIQEFSVAIGEMPKDLTAMGGSSGGSQGNHALAGLTVRPVPPGRTRDDQGVLITRVKPGSSADRSGLRKGDIIVELNRTIIRDIDDFDRLTRKLGPKTPVLILLKRGNGTIYLSIKP